MFRSPLRCGSALGSGAREWGGGETTVNIAEQLPLCVERVERFVRGLAYRLPDPPPSDLVAQVVDAFVVALAAAADHGMWLA
jgi:hypothetical protein